MVELKKENGIMEMIKDGVGNVSKIILASIFPPIAQGAEIVMKSIEDMIIQIEKRIMRRIYSLLIIGLGVLFLIFSLFFFQIEFLGWSKAAAFFSIGITVFVIGLILRLLGYDQ